MFTNVVMINHRRTLRQRLDARRHAGPYSWRPSAPGKGRGFYSGRDALTFDEAGSAMRLRLEWANDHLSDCGYGSLSRIRGYYCDPHGDSDTLKPIIARLPKGRGFLAGWTMGAGMCGALDATIYADAEDAARAAHAMADADAERERDSYPLDLDEAA